MSLSLSSAKRQVKSESFCKVCFDAGKPESEYTSHFVKSEAGSKGKVVCPTLLEMDCTYCKMKGHMKSYCVILKKNVMDRKKECSRAAYDAAALDSSSKNATSKNDKKSNVFGALCCSSDSDSDSEKEVVEDFPALCQEKRVCQDKRKDKKNASIHAASSYASMVSAKVNEAKVLSWVEMNEIDSDDDE